MNGCMNERKNEWMNEMTLNEWMNEMTLNEWMNEIDWLNDWMTE